MSLPKKFYLSNNVPPVILMPENEANNFVYELQCNPKATPLKYRFTKEDGKWRIDLTALMPIADQAMSMLIKKESLDEDTFIISLIESVSGKKVLASIWQPPGK